jgi:hypothetical protein
MYIDTARRMMTDADCALLPVLEKYRPEIGMELWEQWQQGLISASEVLTQAFDKAHEDERALAAANPYSSRDGGKKRANAIYAIRQKPA